MYIAYIAIVTLINVKMYFFSKFDSKNTPEKDTYTKINKGEDESLIKDDKTMKKEKWKNSTYRWLFLGIFVTLNVAYFYFW